MTTAIDSTRSSQAQARARTGRETLGRTVGLALGLATLADGLALAVLAFAGHPTAGRRVAELVLGLTVAVPGLLILKAGLTPRPVRLGILLPEIVLAGALLSLGVAMPAFHQGQVSHPVAVSQFVLVLSALGLGSAGHVLSAVTESTAERSRRLSFPDAVRDGVILIVGTILVAIAIGQLAGTKLMPPMWNWISFLGITIPGMLILVARELVKQDYRRHDRVGLAALAWALVIELMLVGGLFVMIYGSSENLTLGKNGFTTGFTGNAAGLALVVAAGMFLAFVRGPAKRLVPHRERAAIPAVVLGKLAYAGGLIALIYGERAVVMGEAPAVMTGAAATDAVAILVTALVILVIGRTLVSARAGGVERVHGVAAASSPGWSAQTR